MNIKCNKVDVSNSLNLQSNIDALSTNAQVDSSLGLKRNIIDVNNSLNLESNVVDVYTTTNIETHDFLWKHKKTMEHLSNIYQQYETNMIIQ